MSAAYRVTFLDWLTCACAGASSNAARAIRATGTGPLADVAFVATAGHVLDYDDTFAAGVAHVNAACAPAALVLAAHLGLTLDRALAACAEAFEAMAAVAEASHPALYDRGWHPTAVCGAAGAATAAAVLLELDPDQRDQAVALSLLRTGGARGTFGSDGKAIQVGLAAQAGVQAALLARAGARVDTERALTGAAGIEVTLGVRLTQPDPPRGIERNRIKLQPSCLGNPRPDRGRCPRTGHRQPRRRRSRLATGGPDRRPGRRARGQVLDPVLRRPHPAPPPTPTTRLRTVRSRGGRASARDHRGDQPHPPPFSAVIGSTTVEGTPGSPATPASQEQLPAKLAKLAGTRLEGILDDRDAPASEALRSEPRA